MGGGGGGEYRHFFFSTSSTDYRVVVYRHISVQTTCKMHVALYGPFKKRNAPSQRKKAQEFGKAQNAEEMPEIKAICSWLV